MISEVAVGVAVAEKAVKTANKIKKKEIGKMPDEIDELDILEKGLAVASGEALAEPDETLPDVEKVEAVSKEVTDKDIEKLPEEIREGDIEPNKEELKAYPEEIELAIEEGNLPETLNISENAENIPEEKRAESGESKEVGGETEESDEPVAEKKGGSYRDVKKTSDSDHEVHHMPADSASNMERDDGPAIKMEKEDHRQTASCGNSKEAREYRAKQQELIEQGKFREALQMDIDDIHEKFGDKYDDAIQEMMDYVDQLEQEGKI